MLFLYLWAQWGNKCFHMFASLRFLVILIKMTNLLCYVQKVPNTWTLYKTKYAFLYFKHHSSFDLPLFLWFGNLPREAFKLTGRTIIIARIRSRWTAGSQLSYYYVFFKFFYLTAGNWLQSITLKNWVLKNKNISTV